MKRTSDTIRTNNDRLVPTAAENSQNGMTIPCCLEAILESFSQNHEEGDVCEPEEEYAFLESTLGLNRVQSALLAAIAELSMTGAVNHEAIAQRLGCSNMHLMGLQGDIDTLVDKRYVRSNNRGNMGSVYSVPVEVFKCFQKNERPDGAGIKDLGTTAFLRKMQVYFRDFWREDCDYPTLCREMEDLLTYNKDNRIVKGIARNCDEGLENEELLILMYILVRRANFGEREFEWEDFSKIFYDSDLEDMVKIFMERGALDIQKAGIIEFSNTNGIADRSHVVLSRKAEEEFLGDVVSSKEAVKSSCLISCDSIHSKELFYNEEEGRLVDRLSELLMPENFRNVTARLREKGMRSGFNTLFSGTAGTGKSETVYQIARRTGRDIFLVDVSRLKSKWVGESEKNVKELFDDYRKAVANSVVEPILLFNEADAVFGTRMKGAENAVDRMNNALQNIILQELESIEGIMIATTNLTENFCDEAFSRRFIYKIDFKRPGTEAKAKIWESMVEGLDESDAMSLAGEFDLSGGQIENISRKMTVDYILSGRNVGVDGIRELCSQEVRPGKGAERRRIGF